MNNRVEAIKTIVQVIFVGLSLHLTAFIVFSQSPDTISPSTIANLVADTGKLDGTIDLSWTAPGDDNSVGTPSTYMVRYNTEPVTEDNWDTSVDVSGEPVPGPAGTVEEMTIHGLQFGQLYYFAIKTADEASNTSNVSNVANATVHYSSNEVYLPVIMVQNTNVHPVIPDTTKVLTDTTTQYLASISGDGAVFTFTQATPVLDAILPGDVIVADTTTLAPYGFLRKVSSISVVNKQVVIDTDIATIEDAIQSGAIRVNYVLRPDQLQFGEQIRGVTLENASQLSPEFHFDIEDVVLYDEDGDLNTTSDQITANGNIVLQVDFEFDLQVDDFELQELAFTTNINEMSALEIGSGVEYPVIEKEKEILRRPFAPVTVFVGAVPVVMLPVLTINVGVDGSVHAGIKSEFAQKADMRVGVQYNNNSWTPIEQYENQFSFNPPSLSAGVDLKGYANGQLSLMLYGVAGPYAEAQLYMELEADLLAQPWWVLYGGIEVPVGVEIEVLSHIVAGYEAVVIDYKKPFLQAQLNNPPGISFAPVPFDGAIVQNSDVNLAWSGNDLDGDTITYDVYFEADDTTPDICVSDNQTDTVYVLGALRPDTIYYWRIVAEDENGATNVSPTWSFSTRTVASVEFVSQIGDAAQSIFSRDDYLYIGEGNILAVVDIGDPEHPSIIGRTSPFTSTIEDIYAQDNYAYIANGYDGFRVIDIADPANPTEVGSYYTEKFSAPTNGIVLRNGLAYLARGFSGLRIVDISNPTSPFEVGAYDPLLWDDAQNVAVSGNYAYVVNGTYPYIRLIDISNPASPVQTGYFSTSTLGAVGYDVAVSGDYMYVANGSGGLRIIDVSQPATPQEVGYYDMPGYALGVVVSGGYAYVANGEYGLRVVDVSNATNPFEVVQYDTQGYAKDVNIAGGLIYVADGGTGVVVLRLVNTGSGIWQTAQQ